MCGVCGVWWRRGVAWCGGVAVWRSGGVAVWWCGGGGVCGVCGVAWRAVVWRGVAWRGVAWRGVAWRGVAWRGVAWRGVAWRGVAWRGGVCGVCGGVWSVGGWGRGRRGGRGMVLVWCWLRHGLRESPCVCPSMGSPRRPTTVGHRGLEKSQPAGHSTSNQTECETRPKKGKSPTRAEPTSGCEFTFTEKMCEIRAKASGLRHPGQSTKSSWK